MKTKINFHLVVLGFLFFLLASDLLAFSKSGFNFKYGYLLVLVIFLTFYKRVLRAIDLALRKNWKWVLAVGSLIVAATIHSYDLKQSLAWCAWVLFSILTTFTIFQFMRDKNLTSQDVLNSLWWAAGFVTLGALFQLSYFWIFREPIFSPQMRDNIARLNGLCSLANYLNIDLFLLVTVLLFDQVVNRIKLGLILIIFFIIIQSTGKMGWLESFFLLPVVVWGIRRGIASKLLFFSAIGGIVLGLLTPSPTMNKAPSEMMVQGLVLFAQDLVTKIPGDEKQQRLSMLKQGVLIDLDYPWLGVGPRAYKKFVETHEEDVVKKYGDTRIAEKRPDHHESIWLELAGDAGIPLVIICMTFIFKTLWPRLRSKNTYVFASALSLMIYYFIAGQFVPTILIPSVFFIWGIFCYFTHVKTGEDERMSG